MQDIIKYRLDLVLQLIDTTTGREVLEGNIKMFRNGIQFLPIGKGAGRFLCINMGREDFELQINVYGYESSTVSVRFSQLEREIPMKEVFLIPDGTVQKGAELQVLTGKLQGITSIEAIEMGRADLYIKDYDSKGKMTIFNPHNLQLQNVHYGLLHSKSNSYENFTIKKIINMSEVVINSDFSGIFQENNAIKRIIFGIVWEDGRYLLKGRKTRDEKEYLVKFCVKGKYYFQKLRSKEDGMIQNLG